VTVALVPVAVQGRARMARFAALAAMSLLAACVTLAALRGGEWPASVLVALVLLLPLALPLRGILQWRRRTFAWATLCATPYFIYGTMEAVANPPVRVMAGAILFGSLALFVALVACLRLTRPGAPGGSQPS
jgi:uncharacterized membrane protein